MLNHKHVYQYWDDIRSAWILFCDAEYEMQESNWVYPANAWLDIRSGKDDGNKFTSGPCSGPEIVIWSVFYDFHSIMNNEISYMFTPAYVHSTQKFNNLTRNDLDEIDELARLMVDPDINFAQLQKIWDNNKRFRILNSPLVGDASHKNGEMRILEKYKKRHSAH